MHRWRARVAVTILKPLRRRITARAARERACRVEATRTVRVARRVADARLRGGAADVLAALDRIQSSRVPALAQRLLKVVAQNFSASPKAFVHAGFRLYTMSGIGIAEGHGRRADCDAHAENPHYASDVFTLARCRVEGASSMVESSVVRVRETR